MIDLLKKVSEFTGYEPKPNERQKMIDILDDLLNRIEEMEDWLGDFVYSLKTLKLNLINIAANEDDDRSTKFRRTVRENVLWLERARRHFNALTNVLRQEVERRWHHDDQMRKVRDRILKMDDVPFFKVYRDSLWL